MSNHEVRVMRSAILELIIPRGLARLTTGERLDIERVTSRSERGHWKRANFGNALVPYSTLVVLESLHYSRRCNM